MKKAIIIGASSGIGRELAKILSDNNYMLGIVARSDILHEVSEEMTSEHIVRQLDITDTENAMKQINSLISELGGLDLMVVTAGIYFDDHDLIWDHDKQIIDVNVLGFAAMVNVAFNYFLQKGSGHIVGVSSVKAYRGGSKATAYNASKSFVMNYLEGVRKKAFWKKANIYVTTIVPGFIDTTMYKGKKREKNNLLVTKKEDAAKIIYEAIVKKKEFIYISRIWLFIALLLKFLPYRLYKRI